MQRTLLVAFCVCFVLSAAHADWKNDRIWHDGLVEKAVYDASRVVYGRPRDYEMVVFTNKEQHDRRTLTKASASRDTIEVWKHNQIEAIPTPNYTYHYVTTSHLAVGTMDLVRLECSSQEFCGTSFKQYLLAGRGAWDYWAFSYMPEAGRKRGTVRQSSKRVVAADSLPLALRDFDFAAGKPWQIDLLPDQTDNKATAMEPQPAEVRYAGIDGDSHKLELVAGNKVVGTYWMARDRLHVMTRYQGADGQTLKLRELSRVDYWTRTE